MTIENEGYIRIPAPKFELYESVTLYWNEQKHDTGIVKRLFNLDDEVWLYQVAGSEQMYSSDVMEASGLDLLPGVLSTINKTYPVEHFSAAFSPFPIGSPGIVRNRVTVQDLEAMGFDISDVKHETQYLYLFEFTDGRQSGVCLAVQPLPKTSRDVDQGSIPIANFTNHIQASSQ